MNKIILRAITAYTRTDLKSSADVSVSVKGREVEWLGKGYVVLEDENLQKQVAVYRCMNRGELKRMKRWPAGLTEPAEAKLVSKSSESSTVPAILELSAIKDGVKATKPSKSQKNLKLKKTNVNQTDLFEWEGQNKKAAIAAFFECDRQTLRMPV